jgi:CoA:oxalate CoA-transferase
MDATGNPDQPPAKSRPAVCDFSAGVHLYGAVMTALYDRERTGQGRVAEVAMQDATYASLASNLGMHHASKGAGPSRTGNRHGGLGISPYNVYQTLDGYVVINAPGDHHFRAILNTACDNPFTALQLIRKEPQLHYVLQRSYPWALILANSGRLN